MPSVRRSVCCPALPHHREWNVAILEDGGGGIYQVTGASYTLINSTCQAIRPMTSRRTRHSNRLEL
jgi:hypothetical protein